MVGLRGDDARFFHGLCDCVPMSKQQTTVITTVPRGTVSTISTI